MIQLAHRYAALLTAPEGMLREAPADGLSDERNELELQAHWFAGDFGTTFLTATRGERVEIVQFGVWNREAGPDFSDAAVRFPDRDGAPVLRGAIELDMTAEDWERHGHGANAAFNGVILHLYLRQGHRQTFTRTSEHREVAQVQLDIRQIENQPPPTALPLARPGRCVAPLRDLDREQVQTVLCAGAQYRLQIKNRRWQRLAAARGYDQALFQSLAVTLGYKENKLPFALIAQRVPLRVLRAEPASAVALLLGVAGFLQPAERSGPDVDAARASRTYLRTCWEHWWPHRSTMERLVLPPAAWKLGGLRPANHPQRRLAALAQLARHWPQVRVLIDEAGADFAEKTLRFLTALRDEFWDFHFTLHAAPAARPQALIGKSRATEMLANVFFPLAVAARPECWQQYEKLAAAMTNRRVETVVTRLFGAPELGTQWTKTAAHQQGLLQIYEDFCLRDDSDCQLCSFPERVKRFDFRRD